MIRTSLYQECGHSFPDHIFQTAEAILRKWAGYNYNYNWLHLKATYAAWCVCINTAQFVCVHVCVHTYSTICVCACMRACVHIHTMQHSITYAGARCKVQGARCICHMHYHVQSVSLPYVCIYSQIIGGNKILQISQKLPNQQI